MKNLDDVLWKLLGEFVEIDILPKGWKDFEDVEGVKYFCTTVSGYLRIVDNVWVVGNTYVNADRAYKIAFSREVSEKSPSDGFKQIKSC